MKYGHILLMCGAAILAPSDAIADTLIENVKGFTPDGKDGITRFDAMLIGDDGKVAALFSGKDARRTNAETRIDGKGAALLPGFIDSHVHLAGLGSFAARLDLSSVKSASALRREVAAQIKRYPARRWVVGRGWNVDWAAKPDGRDLRSLQRLTRDRPVWLLRADRSAGWANEAALKLAGITAATPDPADGTIVRRKDGQPTGLLLNGAAALMERRIGQDLADDELAAAQDVLIRFGITAVADLTTSFADWTRYSRAGQDGRLHIRIMSYAPTFDDLRRISATGPTPWLYGDHLRLNGLKLFTDGGLHARDAWLKAPYNDQPGNSGVRKTVGAALRTQMRKAAADGFQLAIHAIGDAANTETLDAIDEVAPAFSGDRRWTIIHAQIVDPADIPRFAQHGIIASMSPIHATADYKVVESRLGPSRLAGAHAWRSIAATGARLAFGSDLPIYSPDVFAGFAAAISRTDGNSEPRGGWQPQETVSRSVALAAYTANGAYAGFGENRFGRLAPGLQADFVLLDTDIMTAPPAAIRKTKVRQTWIGGRRVYDADRDSTGQQPGWMIREPEITQHSH